AQAPAHEPGAPAFRLVDPGAPVLSALDHSANRGDGVFETISVGHGRPQSLEHHLRRFERSAATLDLPAPDLDAYRAAIATAVAALPDAPAAWAKAVLSRGVAGGDAPTGWVYATHSGDFTAVRRDGVRVVLLDRGLRHDVEQTSPWLLAGAKTLSYAVNLAAQREAQRRGADDVVFVSSDGYVLEGPTSSVLYLADGGVWTPGTGLGILDGTTQTALFDFFAARGVETGYRLATPADLERADAIWLVSSVRHAAPVRELDGRPVRVDGELTAAMNAHLASLTA
ncbi:MAG: aminodeoxychorismate lyase, partial [Microbacteriaceae bacterium]|nr:aminodeoxychorismate lyase [Microbacteriaceae bacterium]